MDLDRLLQHITHGEQGSVRDFSLALRGLVGRSMDPAENLADVPDKKAARDNLGLGALAERSTVTADLLDPADLGNVNARLGTFSTVADVQNSHIPPVLESIRTEGYNSPGDGGEALYVRVENEPGHWSKIQSADGAWWEKVRPNPGVFELSYYLHPQDLAAARDHNISAQDESRVTAAIQRMHDDAMAWWSRKWRDSVLVVYEEARFAVNDELFSEEFAEALWLADGSLGQFYINPANCTFEAKNWVARSAVRTSGMYKEANITYPVPKAMFRWEQPAARGTAPKFVGETELYLVGEGNVNTDPIAFKLCRATGAVLRNIKFRRFKNTELFIENLFNTTLSDLQLLSGGYQPTEFGGSGFLPDTVTFSNTGKVVTASEPVFTPDHEGLWFGLARAGESWEYDTYLAHFSVIASVDSATQITLSDDPARNVTNRSGTFIGIRGSMTAGSDILTLTAPVSDSLVGRYVSVIGAGFEGKNPRNGILTAVVISHSGNNVQLSHPARYTVSDVHVCVSPQMFIGLTAEALVSAQRTGTTDDVTFENIQVESNTAEYPTVPLILAHCDAVHFAAGSKLHGPGIQGNNFGAAFSVIVLDDIAAGFFDGLMSQGGYVPTSGIIHATGTAVNMSIDGRISEYPSSNTRNLVYVDPSTPTDVDFNLYITSMRNCPQVGSQSLISLGQYGTADMVMDASSTKFPSGSNRDPSQVLPSRFGEVIVDRLTLADEGNGGLFGWGTTGQPSEPLDDANMAVRSGLYKCTSITQNTPRQFGILEVHSFGTPSGPGIVIQRFTTTALAQGLVEYIRGYFPDTSEWSEWIPTQYKLVGPTADRDSPTGVGGMFFDTTHGKPVWWDGTQWVDATGNPA